VGDNFEIDGAVSIVTPDATIRIPMAELVDVAKERERLEREKASVQKQLDGVLARLSNTAFTDKAPAAVVQTARDNAARLQEQLNLLEQSLKAL
jgi:valyl-tRNA synthetase